MSAKKQHPALTPRLAISSGNKGCNCMSFGINAYFFSITSTNYISFIPSHKPARLCTRNLNCSYHGL